MDASLTTFPRPRSVNATVIPIEVGMIVLATIDALIEVTPWDDLQYWPDADSDWYFVDDRTPFQFRVAGELIDDGFFFGLHGPVQFGPDRYVNQICSITLRDTADWHAESKCSANFKVAPTIAKRVPEYDPSMHGDLPFYGHPEGISAAGFPRTSRLGGVSVVS
ncbi:hypothetical protein [Crateriforma spongiae]